MSRIGNQPLNSSCEFRDVPIQRKCQHQIRYYDCRALKVYGLPVLVVQVVNFQHRRVHTVGSLGEEPFEVGKERGVVECPF